MLSWMAISSSGRFKLLHLGLAAACLIGSFAAAVQAAAAVASAAADVPASNSVIPVLAIKSLSGVTGIAGLLSNSTVQLITGESPALQTMFNMNSPATIFVPSDEALSSFARSAGPAFTSKNLLDAFTASPHLFWALMSNQIIDNITVRPQNFSQGQSYTALGRAKLTLTEDDATGTWMVNDLAAINPDYVMAAKTALYAVSRFTLAPDVATWTPLLAAVAAAEAKTAVAAPAPNSSTGSSRSEPLSGYARIGIGVGISLGVALLIGLASLLCVMYKRRGQSNVVDPWAAQNAPTAVLSAAAAVSRSPWSRRRARPGDFRTRRPSGTRSYQHSSSDASSSNSLSYSFGINKWRSTGGWGGKGTADGLLPVTGPAGKGGGGLGMQNGALYAMPSGTVIAPLHSVNSADDSSDDDDDTVPTRRGHHQCHHSIAGGVPEGLEGLEAGSPAALDALEQGFMAAPAVGAMAAAAATTASAWGPQQASTGGAQGVQYPTIFSGALAAVPGSGGVGSSLTPKVTAERLQIFLAQWLESGSPGSRVFQPSTLSKSIPAGGAQNNAMIVDGDADQLQDQGSVEGSVEGHDAARVDPGVAALGSWAAQALAPDDLHQQSPLLRQIVLDLAAGRHPVTHNFTMEDHQAPIARCNTVVLFAHNKNNNKRATLKFYSPRSPGYAAETSAYYQLASRHLPFLESTFNSPDGSYASALVMECGERSLKDMMAEHRPTELPRKIEMFHQLVLDVRHMHSHNLVHRDLQPKHLLFCSEGLQWKLIDFSTTVPANSMVVPEVFSLEYCAPEVAEAVARGDRAMVATAAADMWSVGIMAYEMATGQPFYPAHWTNEEIWRCLLGFTLLPSETLDIVAQATPGEKAFMKKVAHLLQRNPMQRMTAERLASSRLFSACAATTTNVRVQQQLAPGDYVGDGARELFRRLGSINRALERIGFRVEESNALGVDILKHLTVNSLILSVNLQELRPRVDPAALQGTPHQLAEQVPGVDPVAAAAMQGYGRVLETPAGPQVLTAGLSIGQAGALGLVDKQVAPLIDDGSGKPIFLLRQGSSYLVEITVMHAKGQQLPDQTAIESLVLEAPDGSKQTLQLGTTCRSKSQLMVSAVWQPGSSRSKLVSGVTPKRLWGKEGSVPLNLSICLTMCLLPESGATAPSCAEPTSISDGSRPTLLPYASDMTEYQSCHSQDFAAPLPATVGNSSSSRFGRLEPVWVNSEVTLRVCPANTTFKYVRAFRYMEECWSALPPEARGVMQGLVLLVRGVAGGATVFAGFMR